MRVVINTNSIIDKKPIILIVLDVDGTLTDGTVILGNNNLEMKLFSVKDGLIMKMLPQFGIKVLLLTGRTSEAVLCRGSELGCEVVQNISRKDLEILRIAADRKISFDQIAYIGDDLNDYAAMKLCGFKACPADAVAEIKAISDYVSPFAGGHGAVRDICEFILKHLCLYDSFLQKWHFDHSNEYC